MNNSSSARAPGTHRLNHLDGIRGIAALSVVIAHIRWPSAFANSPLFGNASLWVDFFFVLSGFVIAHTYFEKLSGGMSVAAFMARRFARLYPLHLLTLLTALAYEVVKWRMTGTVSIDANHTPFQNNNAPTFAANVFLVHALGLFPHSYWNGPSWSISVEFYTYLLFALLVVVARAKKAVFWVLLFSLQVLSFVVLATCTNGEFLSVETDYGFFRCVLGFGLGVLVQHFHAAAKSEATGGSRDGVKVLIALPIIGLIATPTCNTPITLVAPFLFAILIWVLVRYRGGYLERLLLSRVCQFLGMLSYSIYMTHSLLQGCLRNVWRLGQRYEAFREGWAAVIFNEGLTVIYVALVLTVSWFCYRAVELPAQRWLNKHLNTPRCKAGAGNEAALPVPGPSSG